AAFNEHGVTDAQAKESVIAFHAALTKLETLLADQEFLLGDKPTVLDIAWFINLYRLHLTGYPLFKHPKVNQLFQRLVKRPAFKKEISKGPLFMRIAGPIYRSIRRAQGTTLNSVYRSVESSL
ncbi:MAG: glutathione S-transferase family protein, partial [Pseudomonadota bacterium]